MGMQGCGKRKVSIICAKDSTTTNTSHFKRSTSEAASTSSGASSTSSSEASSSTNYHASRVLPGFEPDSKFRMLKTMVDEVEIIIAINANHIEKSKTRGDLGISYDERSCAYSTCSARAGSPSQAS